LDQDCIEGDDIKFRNYLEEHGFDTSKVGLPTMTSTDDVQKIETVRRKSDATLVGSSKTEMDEAAREGPVIKAVKKGKEFISRLTGVAS
jgi:hypothetical protein